MSRVLRYITHPQIVVDPALPVPQWHLSSFGRGRLNKLRYSGLQNTRTIVSSCEVKAIETAQIISEALGTGFSQREAMHENDRSATGFLRSDEFEHMANMFFANPNESVRGWERAVDAQKRIISEAQTIIDEWPDGDILLVGHGAVGTLLYCHFAAEGISRKFDQTNGGGNYFAVDLASGKALHHWKSIEEL